MINQQQERVNKYIMSSEKVCEKISENVLNRSIVSSKNKQKNSQLMNVDQIQQIEKETKLLINQITQLTQQDKVKLSKYQKKKRDDYENLYLQSRSIFQEFLKTCCALIWIRAFLGNHVKDRNMKETNMNPLDYSQYGTCPILEQKQFSLLAKLLISIIFIFIEAIVLFAVSKLFLKSYNLAEKQRNIIMAGLQLISLTSYAMLLLNSPFEMIGIELISVLFKILLINAFIISFMFYANLRIENIWQFLPRFRRLNSLFTIFFILILKTICTLNNKNINQISALSFFIILIGIIFQYFKSIKYYWRLKKINYLQTVESKDEMESDLKYTLYNVQLLYVQGLIHSIAFTVDESFSLVFYLYVNGLAFGLVIMNIITKMSVIFKNQQKKYIYQVSQSLLSLNKPLANENQPISIGQCFICLSQPARFYIQQCGHLYCGNNCVLKCLEKRMKNCPICRKKSRYLVEVRRIKDTNIGNRKFEIINKYRT